MRSPSSAASARLLRAEERELIAALIASAATSQGLASGLEDRLVRGMDDGGMGSLPFVGDISRARRFGAVLAEGTFLDEGGVLVSVAL
ncbi:MAG: hypothetical protein AB7M12_13875 [Hyphomonadaceae bacterium]